MPSKKGMLIVPKPRPDVENPMRALRVTKVTVNVGVGQGGERLEKAEKVLTALTARKPTRTLAKVSNRDWGLRVGGPIGVKVTLRGPPAVEFVQRALEARNNKVPEWAFDREGNLNFGIPDHTAFEGQKYNPDIGVFGMDVAVTVERPGFRIKHRRLQPRRIPADHRVTREESQAYLKDLFKMEIIS